MAELTAIARRFLELHDPARPLLLANAWDRGSARLFASLGFQALATTSSGHAMTLGRHDGGVTRAEALAHAAEIVAATELPVSADLENGFGHDPAEVAETVRRAAGTGLAGCSIEDFSGDPESPIYERERAAERVAAAVEAARAGGIVLTARSENYLHGRRDLADTIERLRLFEQAGADVLYAPGLATIEDIRELVAAVKRPVNVLTWPGVPPVSELAAAGVSRVSVGGVFAFAGLAGAAAAARELIEQGSYGFLTAAREGARAARSAFD
jgi:2-methylisocitrate lyase-like PEP mutase family enzyme